MTILVTGGTGFLGAYLSRYILTHGHGERVVILDKYIDRGRIADILDRVVLIEGDVSDQDTVRSAIDRYGVERIAHFAFILGSPAVGKMLSYVQVSALGTANVFEAAREAGMKRVLFSSSIAAYGRQDVACLTEDLVPNPSDPYGSTKAWCEALGRHYTEKLGLEVVSVRFGSTYGLGRAWRGSYDSGLLNTPSSIHYMARVEAAVAGEPITMPADGEQADFTYAGDAAQAAYLALTVENLPHDLFNVCSERRTVGEFTQALRELLPSARIVTCESEPPTNPHPAMDNTRLRQIGFAPGYTLKSGLEDYIKRLRAYRRYSKSLD